MRKLTAILMSLLLVFCLTACGNAQQSTEESSVDEEETASSAEESTSDTEDMDNSGNAGGNTGCLLVGVREYRGSRGLYCSSDRRGRV